MSLINVVSVMLVPVDTPFVNAVLMRMHHVLMYMDERSMHRDDVATHINDTLVDDRRGWVDVHRRRRLVVHGFRQCGGFSHRDLRGRHAGKRRGSIKGEKGFLFRDRDPSCPHRCQRQLTEPAQQFRRDRFVKVPAAETRRDPSTCENGRGLFRGQIFAKSQLRGEPERELRLRYDTSARRLFRGRGGRRYRIRANRDRHTAWDACGVISKVRHAIGIFPDVDCRMHGVYR